MVRGDKRNELVFEQKNRQRQLGWKSDSLLAKYFSIYWL